MIYSNFLFMLYQLLCVLLPCAVVFALSARRQPHRRPARRFLWGCVLAVYLAAVFYLTGAGTLFDLLRSGDYIRQGQYNFIPFSNTIDTVAYIQNVLLFMPLGALLPALWPAGGGIARTALFGLAFSVLIEASQMCNFRATDVDDLIMNTAGAVAGWLLWKLSSVITKGRHSPPRRPKSEPVIYVAFMFAGHFLLFNAMGLAKILYGF